MRQKRIARLFRRSLGIGLSFAMALTMLPPMELKAETVEAETMKPAITEAGSIGNSTGMETKDQPFIPGMGGSENFGSPGLVVRKAKLKADGTKTSGEHDWIIAAAEAKYDSTVENWGQGIILSVSEDGGANWNYSFPMHFADSSASFSNPVLVDEETVAGDAVSPLVKGGKIYCFVSAYPSDVSVEAVATYPKPGSGYMSVDETEDQYLALTDIVGKAATNPTADGADYAYYVSKTKGTDNLYPVLNRSNNEESDYAIDGWYNLYKKEGGSGYAPLMMDGNESVQQNIFYTNSALHVYKASYIMYVTSDDDGESWSDPQILNPEIYRNETEVLALSSGKGLRTSAGRIVISVDNKPGYADSTAKASIFWKCIEEGHPWHRSENDVSFGNNWSASGEIVEVSNGRLRMFFQNSQNKVQYVDAYRDDSDMYVFSNPMNIDISVTPRAEISALKYSKTVNGQPAVMLAMPTGSGLTNGMIDTFIPERGGSNQLVPVDGYEVDSTNFCAACIDEMAYGNKIGLIWEDGLGSICFESYDVLDVAAESFVPGLEINLDMNVGETYERTYSGVSGSYVHPDGEHIEPDKEGIIDFGFDKDKEKTGEVPALYARSESNAGSLTDVYQTDADTSVDITRAEFTFKHVANLADSNSADQYIIYSDRAQRYFTYSEDEDAFFTTTGQNNMKVTAGAQEGDFVITNSDKKRKQLLFNTAAKCFEGGDSDPADENVKLLKKLDEQELTEVPEAEQPIPGYQAVTEIVSGRRYLIAHEVSGQAGSKFANDAMVILYPRNELINSSKLVYGTREATISATKTVRIKAIDEGKCSLTVNGITYNVNASNAEVSVPKGGQTFIRTKNTKITDAPDPEVASAKVGTRIVKGLFDRNPEAQPAENGWIPLTDAYQETRDTDLDMSRAEFVIEYQKTQSGRRLYTIYNRYTKSYLMNRNADEGKYGNGSFFGNEAALQDLWRINDDPQNIRFQIVRKGNADLNERFVYFKQKDMRFDATDDYNSNSIRKEEGTAEFQILKKKALPANEDPIPGYERVECEEADFENGTYLITHNEYYTNPKTQEQELAIIILYADNGLKNMSKVYRDVEEDGVWVTAKGETGDSTKITVGGIPYTVVIGEECKHIGTERELKNVAATCEKEGKSGEVRCASCQGLIQAGEEVPKLSQHTPSKAWTVTKQMTVTEDGEESQLCMVCKKVCPGNEYTRTVSRTVAYVQGELKKKIQEIEDKGYQENNYTPDSYQALTGALATANSLKEATDTNVDAVAAAYTALENAEKGLVRSAEITVTFNAKEGAWGEQKEKPETTTDKVTKPDPDPTREDHAFAGWFTEDGTEIIFDNENQWKVTGTTDVTLYAHWTENPTLTLNTDSLNVKEGKKATLIVENVPKGKEDTVSWTVDPAQGVVTVEPVDDGLQATVTALAAAGNSATITVSAEGAKKATVSVEITKMKVTFNANQGIFSDQTNKQEKTVENGKVAKPADPRRDGYTFAGWFTRRDAGDPVPFEEEGGTRTVTGSEDVTLYAHWTEGQETPPAPPTITVTPDELALIVGQAAVLTAADVPTGREVAWSVEPEGVVTVVPAEGNSAQATVTAAAAGTATITASVDGEKVATVNVTVTENSATITVSPSELALAVGGEAAVLTAAGVPEGKEVAWSVEPEGVVTVVPAEGNSAQAVVTAVMAGSATITASAEGATSASVPVTVTNLGDPGIQDPGVTGLANGQTYKVGGITYQVKNVAKKQVIVKKGKNAKTVTIKATVKIAGQKCKIVGIGNNAFKKFKKLQKVTIGNNVASIGSNAFANCQKLRTVTLGTNVKTIGAKAFYGSKKLKTVVLKGKKAPTIKKAAFKKTASKVTIKAKKLKKKARQKLLKKLKKTGKISKKSVMSPK